VWIWFLVDEDDDPSKQKLAALNEFADSVQSDLLKADLRYWPHISFRAVP
jgi:hypothetical protein